MLEDLLVSFGPKANEALNTLSLSYKAQLPFIIDDTINKSSLSLRRDKTFFNSTLTNINVISFQYKGQKSSHQQQQQQPFCSVSNPIGPPSHYEGKLEAHTRREEGAEIIRKEIEKMNSFGSLHYFIDGSDPFWLSYSRESIIPLMDEFSCSIETLTQISPNVDVFNCIGFGLSTCYFLKPFKDSSFSILETLLTERIFNSPSMLEDRISKDYYPFHLQSSFTLNSVSSKLSGVDSGGGGVSIERSMFTPNPTFKYFSNKLSLDFPIYSCDSFTKNLISSTSILTLDCERDRRKFEGSLMDTKVLLDSLKMQGEEDEDISIYKEEIENIIRNCWK